MTHSDYNAALARAQKELAEFEAQQKHIEGEIMVRRRTIASLLELIDRDKDSEVKKELMRSWTRYMVEQSITEDIRKIVRAAGDDGIPKEGIRIELSKLGNSIENHANPAGTINSIVKRLAEKGEVEEHTDGLTGYKTVHWKKVDPMAYMLGGANVDFSEIHKAVIEGARKRK
jgi:hypothetical protein